MPNIAQQDYIIIDWEGKAKDNKEKLAEVSAQLKKLFAANPRSILSVVFDHYDDVMMRNEPILSCVYEGDKELISVSFFSSSLSTMESLELL